VKQPSGARVLVVDDEPAILRTVTANLGRRGFRVDVAQTGVAAIEQVESLIERHEQDLNPQNGH